MCCISPYHSASGGKIRAMDFLYPKKKILKQKNKKKVELYTCPKCHRTINNLPASRWQHRQRNPECKKFYFDSKKLKKNSK